ncbi:mitochondrial outer membrane translocase complex protein [Malassezia pachydermatis]
MGSLAEDMLTAYAGNVLGPEKNVSYYERMQQKELPKYLDEDNTPFWSAPWRTLQDTNASGVSVTSSARQREEEERAAMEEWEEGVRQLQLAFQLVLIPLVGKWFGRRWSYWLFMKWYRRTV